MTLIIGWVHHDFIALVSDGKAISRDQDGNVVPGCIEDATKIHELTPNIALACSGMVDLTEMIVGTVRTQLVEPNRHEPVLFRAIEEAVPFFARAHLQHLNDKCLMKDRENAILLFGYDGYNECLRGVGWDARTNFEPTEFHREVITTWEPCKEFVQRRLNEVLPRGRRADGAEVIESLKGIVKETGEKFPERINTNIFTKLIEVPA